MPGRDVGGGGAGRAGRPPVAAGWAGLTWAELEAWAGSRSVERGRTYQRSGRVKDLRVAGDGALLATVVGGERYATTVVLVPGLGRPSLESDCTCPIGSNCKHAIAVVADYLQAVLDGRNLPVALPDDPRWGQLDGQGEGDEGDALDDDDPDELPARKPAVREPSARRGAVPTGWNDRIEQHIRAKSRGELADLAWSLTRRFPEVYREFQERLALQGGDVDRLVAEARREIRKVTAEPAWQGRWGNVGHIPDYGPIRRRLERLLELGQADPVVALGREFIEAGLEQVGGSHDEGETAMAFAGCLPVVFEAVARSSLSGPERILFAIDASLAADYDATVDAADAALEGDSGPEDWSEVADTLAGRLPAMTAAEGEQDGSSRSFRRDRLTGWIASALRNAGRDGEIRALYESEAPATSSYERLVAHLLATGALEDAERWAAEGIVATAERYPGIAAHLAGKLREAAERRRRWDVVAAHAAREFFDRPAISTFDELMKAAKKARVESTVRATALRFLETGAGPFRLAPPPGAVAPPSRARPSAKSGPPRPRPRARPRDRSRPRAVGWRSTRPGRCPCPMTSSR